MIFILFQILSSLCLSGYEWALHDRNPSENRACALRDNTRSSHFDDVLSLSFHQPQSALLDLDPLDLVHENVTLHDLQASKIHHAAG